MRRLLSVFTFISLTIACQNQHSEPRSSPDPASTFNLEEAKTIIEERTNQFTAAHISKDTAFLNSCFSEDARVFPPNSNIISGSENISELNALWVSYDIHEFVETSSFFYGTEEYLIDEGTYYMTYGKDSIEDTGKYINIWKSVNGEWKIKSNIWNSLETVPHE